MRGYDKVVGSENTAVDFHGQTGDMLRVGLHFLLSELLEAYKEKGHEESWVELVVVVGKGFHSESVSSRHYTQWRCKHFKRNPVRR